MWVVDVGGGWWVRKVGQRRMGAGQDNGGRGAVQRVGRRETRKVTWWETWRWVCSSDENGVVEGVR